MYAVPLSYHGLNSSYEYLYNMQFTQLDSLFETGKFLRKCSRFMDNEGELAGYVEKKKMNYYN